MPRYTITLINSTTSEKERLELVKRVVDYFSENNAYSFTLTPRIIITLSNGINREIHERIHSVISSMHSNIRIASVIHNIPALALNKASRILVSQRFYYEEGVEEEYILGYFKIRELGGYSILDEYTYRKNILYELLNLLEYTGSLPLKIDLNGVLAVLSEKSLDISSILGGRVEVKLARSRIVELALREVFS